MPSRVFHTELRQVLVVAGLLLALLLVGVLAFTQGHFTYSLDDPYIHLALAENLPFNYSINAVGDEAGAPSSSIIYPYLLMPLAHTPLVFLAPLLLNLLGALLVLALLVRLERQVNFIPTASKRLRIIFVISFALLINMFALVFMGMEHVLHIATALAVLSGLLDIAEYKTPKAWFWLAIIIGPLLRYEALALSLAALAYAGYYGHSRRALLVLPLVLLGPILFSLYLHALGYSWLPSSVLSKSAPLTTATEGMSWLTSIVAIFINAIFNFINPTAWVQLGLIVLLLIFALRKSLTSRERGVVLVVLLAALAHSLLGKFGWSGRYHAYTLALCLLTLLYAGRDLWSRSLYKHLAIVLVIGAGSSSLWYTATTPLAAGQIYRYHATLHNFLVTQWQDSVAAYDIGYMAWQNPHTVVDLFGLGSERVRQLIRQPHAATAIPQLLVADKVDLIIAEPSLINFYQAAGWQRVGELHVSGPQLATGLNPQFYLTNPARGPELRAKLNAFRAQLPAGVTLNIY